MCLTFASQGCSYDRSAPFGETRGHVKGIRFSEREAPERKSWFHFAASTQWKLCLQPVSAVLHAGETEPMLIHWLFGIEANA